MGTGFIRTPGKLYQPYGDVKFRKPFHSVLSFQRKERRIQPGFLDELTIVSYFRKDDGRIKNIV